MPLEIPGLLHLLYLKKEVGKIVQKTRTVPSLIHDCV